MGRYVLTKELSDTLWYWNGQVNDEGFRQYTADVTKAKSFRTEADANFNCSSHYRETVTALRGH